MDALPFELLVIDTRLWSLFSTHAKVILDARYICKITVRNFLGNSFRTNDLSSRQWRIFLWSEFFIGFVSSGIAHRRIHGGMVVQRSFYEGRNFFPFRSISPFSCSQILEYSDLVIIVVESLWPERIWKCACTIKLWRYEIEVQSANWVLLRTEEWLQFLCW